MYYFWKILSKMAWISLCVFCNQSVCFTGLHIFLVSCPSWYQICISWSISGGSNSFIRNVVRCSFCHVPKAFWFFYMQVCVGSIKQVLQWILWGKMVVSAQTSLWWESKWWSIPSVLGRAGVLLLPNLISTYCLVIMHLNFSRCFLKSVLHIS